MKAWRRCCRCDAGVDGKVESEVEARGGVEGGTGKASHGVEGDSSVLNGVLLRHGVNERKHKSVRGFGSLIRVCL